MIGEINIHGIFVPALLVLTVAALVLSSITRRVLAAVGFYRYVWHPALFDFCLFIIALGLMCALTLGTSPAFLSSLL
jgi:protein-S-isoprenylcysteine O-methyltransferase Ste14